MSVTASRAVSGFPHHRIMFWGDITTSYNRSVLRAVTAAGQKYPRLRIFLNQTFDYQQLVGLKRLKLSGIIIGGHPVEHKVRKTLEGLMAVRLPIVDVSANVPTLGFPRVCPDDLEVGRVAADYLISRGFRRLICFGLSNQYWSAMRWRGFESRAAQSGLKPQLHEAEKIVQISTEHLLNAIVVWLTHLERPCAIFATADSLAAYLVEACANQGLAVPEDVTVLGCNDDDLFGQLRDPKISSIALNTQQIGATAVTMLHRMITRKKGFKPESVFFPPVRVITRKSSDLFALEDELARRALGLIRDRIGEGISVKKLANYLEVSRATLERRLLDAIGRSPAAEINRMRFERAEHMLLDTDLPVEHVAAHAGFFSRRQFTLAFRKHSGKTPRAYRDEQRHLLFGPPPMRLQSRLTPLSHSAGAGR